MSRTQQRSAEALASSLLTIEPQLSHSTSHLLQQQQCRTNHNTYTHRLACVSGTPRSLLFLQRDRLILKETEPTTADHLPSKSRHLVHSSITTTSKIPESPTRSLLRPLVASGNYRAFVRFPQPTTPFITILSCDILNYDAQQAIFP